MRRSRPALIAALVTVLTCPFVHATDPAVIPAAPSSSASKVDATGLATTLLDHLDAGRYAEAEQMLSAQMRAAVPADKLKQVWESLPASVGPAQGRGPATVATQGDMTVVKIPLPYQQAQLVGTIAIDGSGQIAGFLVQPAPPPAAAPPDASASYIERDFNVGTGERALPGTLALPKGDGPFPAVVLVHGSGAHDRDETIGPNKPFLDIARGLAAQGIAVLRYEKRSKARPQEFTSGVFSVDNETTDDAVLAVDALRKAAGIDPKRVFVLGHSQGGMMAPRIAARSGHVTGLVLLAAPSRSLLDIVIEQNHRLALLDDGTTSDAERAAINAIEQQVRLTRDAATAHATKTLLGQPAGYWRSIDGVDAVAEARAAGLPMLLLQGARDIQVVDADWRNWTQAFGDDARVAFKHYPALNHLGIAGEGEGSLAEYGTPGHVDPQLIADTAAWIKSH